jgi:predicted alpha/beta hydrolase family esterase
MTDPRILLLPGWHDSGPDHWQSRWQALYGDVRVEQYDWVRPLRGDWMSQLEEAVLASEAPVVLVAHSMGCLLVAAWTAHSKNTDRVQAALLVAPGDLEREALRGQLPSWQPIVREPLPFPALLVGSQDDPYCDFERARGFASDWHARFVDYGLRGHLNAESGLGDWPDGRQLLVDLLNKKD